MARDDEHNHHGRPAPERATVPLGPGRARGAREPARAEPGSTPPSSATVPELAELTATTSEPLGRYVPVDPATGAVVADEERGELARGGMGRVICVFDRSTAREVALKERLSEESSSGAARFLQEARVTAQLEHPSIVPIYEIGQRPSGRLYYTMRRVRGKTLADCLAECETLSERVDLLPHFLNLCNAIAFAHDKGVIHRDIKTDNVMVGPFGETVVLDWGLAKLSTVDAEGEDSKLREVMHHAHEAVRSLHGHVLGTPSYLSPEQARGQLELIDERSDVYSLGVVLYELLTGARPFDGESSEEIIEQVIMQEATPVRACERRVPKELAEIATTAMNKDRDLRYRHAGELAAAVTHYLSGTFVPPARGGTRALLAFAWRERRAHLLWALALVLVTALGVGARVRFARDHARERHALAASRDEVVQRLAATEAARVRLAGALAGRQADELRETHAGLALAARALLLDATPSSRERLFWQAGAHAWVTPAQTINLGQRCRFVGTTIAPVCLGLELELRAASSSAALPPRSRLIATRSLLGQEVRSIELSSWSTAAVGRPPDLIYVGERGGVIRALDHGGVERSRWALSTRDAVVFLASDGDRVAALDGAGRIFFIDGTAPPRELSLPQVDDEPRAVVFELSQGPPGALVVLYTQTSARVDLRDSSVERMPPLCASPPTVPTAVGLRALAHGVLVAWSCAPGEIRIGVVRGSRVEDSAVLTTGLPHVISVMVLSADGDRGAALSEDGSVTMLQRVPSSEWRASSQPFYVGAADDLRLVDDQLWVAGEDGQLRVYESAELDRPWRATISGALEGQVWGVHDHGWLLLERDGALGLERLETEESWIRLPFEGAVDAIFARDGVSVLALERDARGVRLARAWPFGEPPRVERWPCPLAGAVKLWGLDGAGRRLLAVGDTEGALALLDYERQQTVRPPWRWADSAVTKVVTDAYAVGLAVLSRRGDLAVGALQAGDPWWTATGLALSALSPTSDGRWLVMLDGRERMWAARFAAEEQLVSACATSLDEQAEPRAGRPATCLEPPALGGLRAISPLDQQRVLLVGEVGLGRYDLFAGRTDAVVPLPAADRALLSTEAQLLLLEDRTPPRASATLLPVNAHLLGPPSAWRDEIERLTGHALEEEHRTDD